MLVDGIPPWAASTLNSSIDTLVWLTSYLFSWYGISFALGALLFSAPDWPCFRSRSTHQIVGDTRPLLPMDVRHPPVTPPVQAAKKPDTKIPETVDERHAKAELASFVAQHLIPAVRAQLELQAAAIKKLSNGASSMEKMATWGNENRRRGAKEYDTYAELERAVAQNFSNITFDDLMQKIVRVHTFYIGEASRAGWICRSANVDYRNDDNLRPHYKMWRRLADDVEKTYRRFVVDVRFTRIWKAAPTREVNKDFVTDQ